MSFYWTTLQLILNLCYLLKCNHFENVQFKNGIHTKTTIYLFYLFLCVISQSEQKGFTKLMVYYNKSSRRNCAFYLFIFFNMTCTTNILNRSLLLPKVITKSKQWKKNVRGDIIVIQREYLLLILVKKKTFLIFTFCLYWIKSWTLHQLYIHRTIIIFYHILTSTYPWL